MNEQWIKENGWESYEHEKKALHRLIDTLRAERDDLRAKLAAAEAYVERFGGAAMTKGLITYEQAVNGIETVKAERDAALARCAELEGALRELVKEIESDPDEFNGNGESWTCSTIHTAAVAHARAVLEETK